MRHVPRKRFGQHFLVDPFIIAQIVKGIDPRAQDRVVEIGPGLGALTEPLLKHLAAVTVIEIDRDLVAHWRKNPRLRVIAADVLSVDFAAMDDGLVDERNTGSAQAAKPSLRLVGNLPYNISTPILFHLLPFAHRIIDQHFMLQKEVIDRMVASPATADYGRLSVMLQWRYAMKNFLDVPHTAFDPPPRVQSAMIRMLPYPQPAALDAQVLEALVKVAFSQRRKLLRHALGRWLDERSFSGHFDLQRRAEEVPVAEYVELAQSLSSAASTG